jgi:hypothetical protein
MLFISDLAVSCPRGVDIVVAADTEGAFCPLLMLMPGILCKLSSEPIWYMVVPCCAYIPTLLLDSGFVKLLVFEKLRDRDATYTFCGLGETLDRPSGTCMLEKFVTIGANLLACI